MIEADKRRHELVVPDIIAECGQVADPGQDAQRHAQDEHHDET
ncbi:hypothetical protein [Burkholderia territorii]|nr:hypothetical protein [Burkholderia territorii]